MEPPIDPREPPEEPMEPPIEPREPPEEPMEPWAPPDEPIEPREEPMEPCEPPMEPCEPPEEPELPLGEGIETGGPPEGEDMPPVVWQFARTSTAESATQKPEIRTVSFITVGRSSRFEIAYHRHGRWPFRHLMRQSAFASLTVLVVIQPAGPHRGRIVSVSLLLALLPNAPHHPGSQIEQHEGKREQRAHVVEEKAEQIHSQSPRMQKMGIRIGLYFTQIAVVLSRPCRLLP